MSETFGFQLLLACKSHRMQSPVVRRCLPCMQVTPHVLVLDHGRKRLAPLTPLYNAVAEIKNCDVAKQTVMSQGSTPSKQNHTEQLSCKQHSGKFAISPKGSYLLLDSARRDRAKAGAAGGGCSGRASEYVDGAVLMLLLLPAALPASSSKQWLAAKAAAIAKGATATTASTSRATRRQHQPRCPHCLHQHTSHQEPVSRTPECHHRVGCSIQVCLP